MAPGKAAASTKHEIRDSDDIGDMVCLKTVADTDIISEMAHRPKNNFDSVFVQGGGNQWTLIRCFANIAGKRVRR
jgi:hypothetical protein